MLKKKGTLKDHNLDPETPGPEENGTHDTLVGNAARVSPRWLCHPRR